jgi:hypothetical protein
MAAKKRNLLVLISIVVVLISVQGYHIWKRSELKRNGTFLTGKITSWQPGSKSQWWFTYEFQFNNQTFKRDKSASVNNLNFFVGKTFPVIFSTSSKSSDILITPRDFEKYKIRFPDSLKWVKGYVDKGIIYEY